MLVLALATQNTGHEDKNKQIGETVQQQRGRYCACRLNVKCVYKLNRHTALNIQDPCSV